jgi:aldehyde:ferredoxin oxidoreductase
LKAVKEYFVVTNLMGICDFDVINTAVQPTTLAELYYRSQGLKPVKAELLRKAERTIALERAFNYARGFTRKDDRLPMRFMKEPAPFGPPKDQVVDMETCLDRFYEACSFDREKAIPTLDKYQELGMAEIGEAIYQAA